MHQQLHQLQLVCGGGVQGDEWLANTLCGSPTWAAAAATPVFLCVFLKVWVVYLQAVWVGRPAGLKQQQHTIHWASRLCESGACCHVTADSPGGVPAVLLFCFPTCRLIPSPSPIIDCQSAERVPVHARISCGLGGAHEEEERVHVKGDCCMEGSHTYLTTAHHAWPATCHESLASSFCYADKVRRDCHSLGPLDGVALEGRHESLEWLAGGVHLQNNMRAPHQG